MKLLNAPTFHLFLKTFKALTLNNFKPVEVLTAKSLKAALSFACLAAYLMSVLQLSHYFSEPLYALFKCFEKIYNVS